ncbi:MAG: hypothetical protein ACE37J_19295 [Pikeienuella sp.]
MRRLIGLLLGLALLAAAGLVGYAYLGDLSSPVRPVEAPASGVGFGS